MANNKIAKNEKVLEKQTGDSVQENTRYIWLCQGIAIILLVCSHIIFLEENVSKWMAGFAIPLLMALEGAKVSNGFKDSWRDMVKSYLFPYLSFSVIMLVTNAVFVIANRDGYTSDLLRDMLINFIIGYGSSVLWIFPALLTGMFLYRVIRLKLNRYVSLLIMLVLFLAYIISGGVHRALEYTENPFVMYFLRFQAVIWRGVVAGVFIGFGDTISYIRSRYLSNKGAYVTLGLFAIILGSFIMMANTRPDMKLLLYGNPALFFFGAAFVITGMMWICEWINVFGIMEWVGKNWKIIYLSFLDLRVMYLALLTDASLLAALKNRFVAHTGFVIIFILIECAIIFVFSRYLYVLVGQPALDGDEDEEADN